MNSQKKTPKVLNKNDNEKFNALLKNASVSVDGKRDYQKLGRSYGHNNALLGWESKPFIEAVKSIKLICPKISKKTIGNEISRSIQSLFERRAVNMDADPNVDANLNSLLSILDQPDIEDELNRLINYLNTQVQTYTIIFPVDGIDLLDVEIKLGEITLHSVTKSNLLSEISDAFEDDLVKEGIKKPFIDSGCYISVDIEGDFNHACQEALIKAQNILDIINLYLASCKNRVMVYEKICLAGHPIQRSRGILGRIQSEESDKPAKLSNFSGKVAPYGKYSLSKSIVNQWKKDGLEIILKYSSQGYLKSDSISSRVQRATTWNSKGINADNTDEQFLDLAVALESLLIGSEGDDLKITSGSINQKLSERIAFLLGKNCEDRINYAKDVKYLYGIRSKIVHQGHYASWQNLYNIEEIVKDSIFAFIKHDFSSWDDFIKWIEVQKFSTNGDHIQ